jgi:hypothetical protein
VGINPALLHVAYTHLTCTKLIKHGLAHTIEKDDERFHNLLILPYLPMLRLFSPRNA